MTDKILMLLKNYLALVDKINSHIQMLEKTFSEEIACKKGCDTCCRNLSVFPVEALNLSRGFTALETELKQAVIRNIEDGRDRCPLLVHHVCALYHHRPVICRTHGYPLLIKENDKTRVDFCPDNFKTIKSFSREHLLDLDQLNTTLLAVNRHFLSLIESDTGLPDRLSMANALLIFKTDDPD